MTKEQSDFVTIDEVCLHKDVFLQLAKNSHNPMVAEHFLMPLAYYAAVKRRQDIIDEVEEIRNLYNFAPLPAAKPAASSENYAPDFSTMAPPEDRARAAYKKLKKEDRRNVLRTALSALMAEDKRLFKKKSCWIGIYFVVRDRLDGTINQTNFFDFAVSFTPDGWPENLRIAKRTLSNLARELKYEDRNEAYYDMDENPWAELCERYWALVLNGLLTKK